MTMEGDETFSVNSDFFESADLLAKTKPEKGWFGKEKMPILTYSYYITSRERLCTVMDGDVVVQTDVKIPSRVSGVTVKHNEQGWTEAFVIKGKATKVLMHQEEGGERKGKLMLHFLGRDHMIEEDIDAEKFDRLRSKVHDLRQE